MAGRIVTNSVQLGDSATANNNFVWQTNVDGTAKLSRGVVGALTQDILAVDALGGIAFPQHRYAGVNVLLNALFNINQRLYVSATATTVANQYTLDRWRVITSGQSVIFTALAYGSQITAPVGGVEQVIEGSQIGFNTAVINWTGTATCTVDGVARNKGDFFTVAPGTNCAVRFFNGTVSFPQVEAGRAPTSFHFRPPQDDRVMCQRYFNQLEWYWQAGSPGLGVGIGFTWVFPCVMRIVPVMSYFNITLGSTPNDITITADRAGLNAPGNANGQTRFSASANAEI